MKKLISIFLLLAMLTAIVPLSGITAVAATTELPTTSWTDSNLYDVSWCTAGTENGTDSVKIDGSWYKILNYASGTVFEIKDAADLAGLAKLTNGSTNASRDNTFFANCTFKITAETIDLSAHLWTPIAANYNTKVFGGHLIGASGENGTGNVTIQGMTINYTGSDTGSYSIGLIGVKGGGSVKNLTLEDAYISTMGGYSVGSFVGRQWGPLSSQNDHTNTKYDEVCTTFYENLTSDATIIRTHTNNNAMNATGGIAGSVNSGYHAKVAEFENCTFTGSIQTKQNNVGGIVGYSETGGQSNKGAYIKFTDCVVSAPITVSAASYVGATTACGVGGLIGGTKSLIEATTCTVSSAISAPNNVKVGGMVGGEAGTNQPNSTTDRYMSFTGCEFSGTIDTSSADKGLYIGKTSSTLKVTLNNCKVSSAVETAQSMYWLGNVTATTFDFTGSSSSVLTRYSSTATEVPNVTGANDGSVVGSLKVQKHTDGTKLRVSAQIRGTSYDTAAFEYFVTYTDANGKQITKINEKEVFVCYRSIVAGERPVEADAGYFFIVFVIEGFESSMTDISVGLTAKVTNGSTTTYSQTDYITLPNE